MPAPVSNLLVTPESSSSNMMGNPQRVVSDSTCDVELNLSTQLTKQQSASKLAGQIPLYYQPQQSPKNADPNQVS